MKIGCMNDDELLLQLEDFECEYRIRFLTAPNRLEAIRSSSISLSGIL